MSHLSTFRERMLQRGHRAAILSDPVHQRYLSGFPFEDGLILVTDTTASLITDFRYAEAARAICKDRFDILTPAQGALACARGILEDGGIDAVLFEEADLSYEQFQAFGEKLGKIEPIAGASELLAEQRAVKTEEELASMARAQSITDLAFSHMLEMLHPDMTEVEVALELEFFMRRQGAESVAFNTIAVSGSASARPHGVPRPQKLERGFLTMDFGARVDGYCSDMTRTVVIGRADPEMKRLYNTVLTAQQTALAAAAEGASCFALDKIARDIIDQNGYRGAFGHSLGHGVGIRIHERPNLSPKASPEKLLQRGNVVTFEPGIYLEGLYGCRIEDMVAIRLDGSVQNFTKSTKELIEIE